MSPPLPASPPQGRGKDRRIRSLHSPIEITKEISLPYFFFEHLLRKTSNYEYVLLSEMYVNPFEDEIGLVSVWGPGTSFPRPREPCLWNVTIGRAGASIF